MTIWGIYIYTHICLKPVLENAMLCFYLCLNRQLFNSASINDNIWFRGSLAGLTDGRALLNLVQVALFNKHRKE